MTTLPALCCVGPVDSIRRDETRTGAVGTVKSVRGAELEYEEAIFIYKVSMEEMGLGIDIDLLTTTLERFSGSERNFKSICNCSMFYSFMLNNTKHAP